MKRFLQVFTAVIPMITAMSNTFFLNTKIYHYQNKYQQNSKVYKQENKETLQNKGQTPNKVPNFNKNNSFNNKNTTYPEGRHPFVYPFLYFDKKSVPWADQDDNDVSFFQAQNGTIYVATDKYFYYSTDGINFKTITSINETGIPKILQAQNGTIYVEFQSGEVYSSTDGINFYSLDFFYGKGPNQIFQAQNGVIFVCTDSGVYSSMDGKNFNSIKSVNNNAVDHIFQAQNGTIYIIEFNFINRNNFVYYYSNDGINFNKVSGLPIFNEDLGNSFIQAQNGTIYVVIDGSGLYSSTDGKVFNKIKSVSSDYINCIYQAQNGTIYVGTNVKGVYSSTDGKNFSLISTIPASFGVSQILQAQNGTIYMATLFNGLYYSENGITFNKATLIPDDLNLINSIFESQNGTIYFSTTQGLFISNKYSNFIQVQGIPSDSSTSINNVFQAKNGTIYVNTKTTNPFTEVKTFSLFTNGSSTFFNHMSINSLVNDYWQMNNQDIYYEVRKNTVTFLFDQDWVSRATVSIDNKTPLSINPKQKYTLTNNTKDAETATVTISNVQKTSLVYHFILDKNGASTLTFNKTNAKDSRGDDEYALNLYINGYQSITLDHDIAKIQSPYYSDPVLGVLTNKFYMSNNPWNNIFKKNCNLESTINNDGGIISSTNLENLYDALTIGDSSVLNFDGPPYGQYDQYRGNLDKNINQNNHLQDPSNPNGIILHFVISTDEGAWYIDNFDETDYNQAYNKLVLGQI